ncbi:right-handed parallel beta-helix repeat-containing protein [Novipirellula artificiosorum]|nr:right-handed parallel beta-helix repeat-containing protein [Novipirellula artificiosorum]
MFIRSGLALLVALSLPTSARAAEWFVEGSIETSGDGSTARPFKKIGEAIDAMQGGDIVTVGNGVYHESLRLSKGGSQDQPSTIRAATGSRVIVSGFSKIGQWQPFREGVYATTVPDKVTNLYVGYRPQRIASSLDKADAWVPIVSSDVPGGIVDVGDQLNSLPAAAEIVSTPANVAAFVFFGRGNVFKIIPVDSIDSTRGRLAMNAKELRGLGANDRLTLCNHHLLIDRAGEWACESEGDKWKLYFMPGDADDLLRTQTVKQPRPLLTLGHWKDPQSDFRVEGIEFAGSGSSGLSAGKVQRLTVDRCIVHNHANSGVSVRNCQDIRVAHSIAFANHTGISIVSTQRGMVEQNEVLANYVDGIIVAGDISGKDAEPETHDVTLRQNYVHHHLLHGHPDNFQTYRGVHGIQFHDNLILLSGQGLMTEQTYGGELTNNVFFGTSARLVIFGHHSSNDWTVTHNTFGFGGWGSIGMDGKNYVISQNLFLNNVLNSESDFEGQDNLFLNDAEREQPIPGNLPHLQGIATDLDQCRDDRLALRGVDVQQSFRVGDQIEINGDGRIRTVTEVSPSGIDFSPALPVRPWRNTIVWNWRTQTDFSLAFSAVESDGVIGATLDAAAYRAGDFDGDGQRDLPEMSADLRSSIPEANDLVVLLHLP